MDRGVHATGGDAVELLERSGQLSKLGDRLDAVSATSRGQIVLVRGEAGIGKTALLRAFSDGLDSSVRVLWASCDALFTPRPLGPLLDIARSTDGELSGMLENGARPHDVAAAMLSELESPPRTVLVLEDLHWADEATLDVVRLVGRRIESVPALLVVSYRDDQLDRAHPLRIVLGELPGVGAVTRLELLGLSPTSVAALAEGSTIDAETLYDRTMGNSFFVTEVLAAGEPGVPNTVRDAVLARTARLSPEARGVLDAVAIVPQRTEVWLLEALVHAALDGIEECLSSGMLRAEADGVTFRHELARLAVEGALAPDRAVTLHRRAVSALVEPTLGPPDHARLAHHAEGAGDTSAVLCFASAAAEEADSLGSPREAQHQYARALRFGPGLEPSARAELLERFAAMGYLTDMREPSIAALDEALRIHQSTGDLRRQGEVLRQRSRLLTCMGRSAESKVAAREAIAVLEQAPPGPELARAYSALSHVSMLGDDTDNTIFWGHKAIDLAERFGDVDSLVNALNNVGTIEFSRGTPTGRDKLERSLALAKQAGLGPDVGRAYINLIAVLARRREWTEIEGYLEPGIDYCRDHGLEAWLKCLIAGKAEAELGQGRWGDAAETATSLLTDPRDPIVGPRHDGLVVLALVRARRGDPHTGRCSTKPSRSRNASATSSSWPMPPPRGQRPRGWKAGPERSPRRPTTLSRLPCSWESRPCSQSSPCGAGAPTSPCRTSASWMARLPSTEAPTTSRWRNAGVGPAAGTRQRSP